MKLALFAVAAATLAIAAPANAALLNFTMTGTYTAFWQMDSAPTPYRSDTVAVDFNVTGVFEGVHSLKQLSFYRAESAGGLQIYSPAGDFEDFEGDQLFTGPVRAPVFAPGAFLFFDEAPDSLRLTISLAQAPVPEPALWGLMIVGFGLSGAALRRPRTIRI